jgi:tyrosyl-tRNA synthetase
VKLSGEEIGVIDLLTKELNLVSSTSEARRLIQQGGFKIDDRAVTDVNEKVMPKSGMIIRAGKKKIVKVI